VNRDWRPFFACQRPEIKCGRWDIFIRSCSRSSYLERRCFSWKA
jgi:hypothetical protein